MKKIKQYWVIKKLEMLLNCRWRPKGIEKAQMIFTALVLGYLFIPIVLLLISSPYAATLPPMGYLIWELSFLTWCITISGTLGSAFIVGLAAFFTRNSYLIAQTERWAEIDQIFIDFLYIDLDKRQLMTNRLAQEKIAYEKMNLANQICEVPVKKNMNKI